MGILVNNPNEQRSQLQERVAAELQERLRAQTSKNDLPDGVEDSAYIKDTKPTTTLAWAWILIVIIAIAGLIWLISSFTR